MSAGKIDTSVVTTCLKTMGFLFVLSFLFFACRKEENTSLPADGASFKIYDFYAYNVVKAQEKGYVISSSTGIQKVDENGDIIWNREYTSYNDSLIFDGVSFQKIVANSEGGYTIMGFVIYHDKAIQCLIGLDAEGSKKWVRLLNFSYVKSIYLDAYTFTQTNDGGYVVSFMYLGPGEDYPFRNLVKLSKSGVVEWDNPQLLYNTFTDNFAQIRDIIQSKTGDIILVGSYDNLQSAYFGKYSIEGNLILEKEYRIGTYENNIRKIVETKTNDFVLLGYTDNGKGFDRWNYQFLSIKVNSVGDTLKSKVFGTPSRQEYCYSGVQTKDNGFALIGLSSITQDAPENRLKSSMYFVKMDQTLSTATPTIYGEGMDTQGIFASENNDGSFTLIGPKFGHENLGKSQTMFIKTNSTGGL